MTSTIGPGAIVVATDGSHHADRAVIWAAVQASLERRRLVVVTTDHTSGRRINDLAVQRAGTAAPGVDVVGLTSRGDPRVVLTELSQHAHLLVLGSRGLGGVRSMLLGSVSATLCRWAFCPVVVCRPPAEGHRNQGVLVGVNGMEDSRAILEFGFEQAALRGQRLTVVQCVWDVAAAVAGMRHVPLAEADVEDDDARRLLSEAIAGFAEKYPDVSVSPLVMHGLVDEVLGGRTAAWDLVVVGRYPVDSVSRLVAGSIATAVLERARTNVAIVPIERSVNGRGRPAAASRAGA